MSHSHIVVDDDDFVQPVPRRSAQQTNKEAFKNFLYGFIESTVEAKRAVWNDLYECFDETHGDRWYMWWGKREWRSWVDHILQRCRVNDPSLHGCVIYSTASDTSYRYQNGYGKWMYRATNYDNMLGKWDTSKVPLPTTKTSEQVHRLLAYLCTNNKDLRYAVGHFKKPERDAGDMKDSSPLILVHLCNNGENGCVNPSILYWIRQCKTVPEMAVSAVLAICVLIPRSAYSSTSKPAHSFHLGMLIVKPLQTSR